MTKTITRAVSVLLAVALVGASPSPAGAGSADAAYVALAQGYYAQTFKLSPIEATQSACTTTTIRSATSPPPASRSRRAR